jgi:N-acetylneuraminic acid mutarotase
LENREWTVKKDFGHSLDWACATFIPGDDKTVYITGGYYWAQLSEVWVYSFEFDNYTRMENNLEVPLTTHGCTGYVKPDNTKTVIIAGGEGIGFAKTVAAWIYDVEQDQWDPLPDLPTARAYNILRNVNNTIYSFGGHDATGVSMTEIVKLNPEVDTEWTYVGDMSVGAKVPIVVPYNL